MSPAQKHAPRRHNMKTNGVKLLTAATPLLQRSEAELVPEAPTVWMTEPSAQREPPLPPPSRRGSLTRPQTSCSMWACRTLESRHTSHFRVVVSSSAAAYPNCGKCIHLWVNSLLMLPARLHLIIYFWPFYLQLPSLRASVSRAASVPPPLVPPAHPPTCPEPPMGIPTSGLLVRTILQKNGETIHTIRTTACP